MSDRDPDLELLRAVRRLAHHPHLPDPLGWALRASAVGLLAGRHLASDDPELLARLERCRTYLGVCGAHLGLIAPVTEVSAALARFEHRLALRPVPRRILAAPPTLEPQAALR